MNNENMKKLISLILTSFMLLSLTLFSAGCSAMGPEFGPSDSVITAENLKKGKDGAFRFRYKAENAGYYDLTVEGTSGKDAKPMIKIGGKFLSTLETNGSKGFETVTLWLDKGTNDMAIGEDITGNADFSPSSFKLSPSSRKISMIIAPHEDDEVLGFAGIIQQTRERGDVVKVVLLTNGDYFGEYLGPVRIKESIDALAHLGVKQSDVIVMGYGDLLLESFFSTKETKKVQTAKSGRSETSGNTEIGAYEYHYLNTKSHAQYTSVNFKRDLYEVIRTYRPAEFYTTHDQEWHPDHKAAYWLTDEAITSVMKKFDYHPVLRQSVIHGEELTWPERLKTNADGSYTPEEFTNPFPSGKKPFDWGSVTKVKLTDEQIKNKYEAIKEFVTQNDGGEGFKGNAEGNFAFVKTEEFYISKQY